MKVSIEIELTPAEARKLVGLPDFEPMQKAVMDKLEDKIVGGIDSMSPDALVKRFVPIGLQGFEQAQKIVSSVTSMAMGSRKQEEKAEDAETEKPAAKKPAAKKRATTTKS